MFELNHLLTAGKFFIVIASELILIFVAVSFVIGIITEYLPSKRVREFLSKKASWLGYFFGAGFGALTPFCSCSTVPITVGLLQGGVSFGPSMAFLFSSPILNPVIITLFWTLLGYQVTILYILVTFSSMLTAALLSKLGMEKQAKFVSNLMRDCYSEKPPIETIPTFGGCCHSRSETPEKIVVAGSCCPVSRNALDNIIPTVAFVSKIKRAFLFAIATFKQVLWYLLLGAAIGALIYGFFPQDIIIKVAGPGNLFSIPIAAVIGVPMYIRAETVIPISAALVEKGMGMDTVLALIIGGAGASIPEITILASLFKKKLLLAFILNVFLIAISAGYLVDYLLY